MAATLITWDDKVTFEPHPEIPDENKVTADDMNQVKTVMNNNAKFIPITGTASSSGGGTTFTVLPIPSIPAPYEVFITPKTADAAGAHYVTNAISGQFTVEYISPTNVGVGNIGFAFSIHRTA
jgi:hypothetical protein